ncbi:MAG: hypothetical protein SH850_23885 [Planctomycetaceae bacterium]|nr:hypothetical protein [Planctomycetaceae bacterium]
MTSPRRGPGLLFHLAAGATAVFIVTVFALVATLFADPAAPVNIWFNAHAGTLLAAEVAAIAVLGVVAMGRDQWLQRRESSSYSPPSPDGGASARSIDE